MAVSEGLAANTLDRVRECERGESMAALERTDADTNDRVRQCEGLEFSAIREGGNPYFIYPVRDDNIDNVGFITTTPDDFFVFNEKLRTKPLRRWW